MLDKDNNGKLSKEDLNYVLYNSTKSEKEFLPIWEEICKEADTNN